MKTVFIVLFLLVLPILTLSPSFASDITVNSDMQICVSNEDCTLVSNSCAQPCGFVPANKAIVKIVEETYFTKCGKAMESTSCKVTPPIAAMCVNGRCTLDAAYKETATPKDYQAGAYAVPEAPEASKVQGDFSNVDDRDGKFSAYNLPEGEVKQKTVGQIIDKIYVPADAPVKGENYIAIPSQAVAPETPAPTAPVAPAPAVAPTPAPVAPVMPAPTAPSVAPPKMVEQPAIPMSDIPDMRPTRPNQAFEATQKPVAPPVVAPPVYPAENPVVSPPVPTAPDDMVLLSPDTTVAPNAPQSIVPAQPKAELTPMIDVPDDSAKPSVVEIKKPADADKKSFGASKDKSKEDLN